MVETAWVVLDELEPRLTAHCRRMVAAEVDPSSSRQSPDDVCYAVGVMSLQRDRDWLAPDEIRLGRVADRDALLERHPEAGAQIVWNVPDFRGSAWALLPHMMDPQLEAAEAAMSAELTRELGTKAAALIYDAKMEAALREVAWAERFALTDDFVVFTWDVTFGTRLRESLKRNAAPNALEAWAARGWLRDDPA
jgi:hypothetical protein